MAIAEILETVSVLFRSDRFRLNHLSQTIFPTAHLLCNSAPNDTSILSEMSVNETLFKTLPISEQS